MDALDQLRPAFDAVPTPMLVVDSQGLIRLVNGHLEALFGYADGELIGQPLELLVPDEVRGHHPELRAAFFAMPRDRRMGTGRDLFGVCRSGERVPLEIGLTPLAIAGGPMVLASVLDISERKRHEERFRLAVDAAAAGMVLVTPDGTIDMVNSQLCAMFGYERSELVGQSIELLVPVRVARRHSVYRASYFHRPEKRSMGREHVLTGQHRDGTEVPVEVGLTPIESIHGPYVMATVVDVTRHRLHEAEIRRKNDALSRLNAELMQFAYSASHDLKAPLASIHGLARAAKEDIDDGELEEATDNLGKIQRLAHGLAELVENLLQLGHVTHDVEGTEVVELAPLCDLCVEHLRGVDGFADVSMVVDVQVERFPTVATRFTRIVENLLSNAIRYADPQKLEPFVRLSITPVAPATVGAGGLSLVVADNGIGIPAAHQQHVFEPFRRFAPKRCDGHGLGLALVRRHVEALRGTVTFESSPQGTCFTVFLPHLEAPACHPPS